jgi:hypothetical protein
MNKHRPWASIALAALVALVIAAVAVAAPAGNSKKQTVASLKKQVATLKAQNQKLSDKYSPKGIAKQLAKAKAALAKYQDVDVAKADGYAVGSPCVMEPSDPNASSYGGAMGVHFVNPALLKPGPLNPAKPAILLYEPTSNGGFQLMGAEYFQGDADQNVKTDPDRPTLFGRAFDGPMQGHSPGMPIHFDLHVWLFQHNPSGMFAPFNPDAHC